MNKKVLNTTVKYLTAAILAANVIGCNAEKAQVTVADTKAIPAQENSAKANDNKDFYDESWNL